MNLPQGKLNDTLACWPRANLVDHRPVRDAGRNEGTRKINTAKRCKGLIGYRVSKDRPNYVTCIDRINWSRKAGTLTLSRYRQPRGAIQMQGELRIGNHTDS